MARKLDQWPAPAATSRYPWDQFLDGDPWELLQGEDFHSRPSTFVANARAQAKRRGGTVRTRLLQTERGNSVVIQFVAAR
jgi:hypothetical protein